MKMYIAGEWIDTEEKIEVLNPYNGEVVDTVPNAAPQEVEKALASATRGAQVMAELPAYQRFTILMKAAGLLIIVFAMSSPSCGLNFSIRS